MNKEYILYILDKEAETQDRIVWVFLGKFTKSGAEHIMRLINQGAEAKAFPARYPDML